MDFEKDAVEPEEENRVQETVARHSSGQSRRKVHCGQVRIRVSQEDNQEKSQVLTKLEPPLET